MIPEGEMETGGTRSPGTVDLEAVRSRLKEKLRACIQLGKRKLASGKETDFYFDGRLVSLDPEGSVLIAELMLDLIRKGDGTGAIDAVGGLTSGADPITSSIGVLAWQKKAPLKLFYVRKEAKDHGMGKRIEGPPLAPGARAVIVDDVITTGGSILKARDTLRDDAKAVVVAALAIIDREEGGRQALEKEGLKVLSLFRKTDFLP